MVAEAIYAQDSLSTAVRSFGAALATGRTVEDVEAWPERIGAVTARAGQCGRRARVPTRASVTGRLLPAPDVTAAARPAPAAGAAGDRSRAEQAWLMPARRSAGAGSGEPSARSARRRPAAASKVERVVSPGGIEAYLIREPSIPFLSLALHFRGGAALDPAGKEGLAYMVSGLLDEGAGDLDSQAFRTELEDRAIRLSFEADRDEFTGQLKTLTRSASAPSSCCGWR